MGTQELLFNKHNALALQDHQRKSAQEDIANLDGNRLLNSNPDDLVAYVVEKYRIDVPNLLDDQMSADQREAKREVSSDPFRMSYGRGPAHVNGTEVIVDIPFSGDAEMFRVQPSTHDTGPPRAEIQGNSLRFRYWSDNPSPEQARGEIDRWLESIRRYLQWQRDSFRGFNDGLADIARRTILQRREKLLANQKLVAALGIPLKQRHGDASTYAAPEVKRKVVPKLPPATAGSFKPEPVLEAAEYEHILSVIESMVKVMERSPKAFYQTDEEAIRTHFLVQLNGHYEGQATGETFNYQGKTDILIRSADRNVFVAECKFWGGPVKLTETIDQLLGYLTWRDSKAAILLFNRNKDLSKVLATIPEVVQAHPNFAKAEGRKNETSFRYSFRHKDDPAKLLHLTVLVFDVPKPTE